jgi:hypothetical protein
LLLARCLSAEKARRFQGNDDLACFATGKAVEEQSPLSWPNAERRSSVVMGRASAQSATRLPLSSEPLDDMASFIV